jgi:DeoR/GlpR family transcriptional regulator of sugar metabolism
MARILVERGSVKKLATLFEVSEQTVRNALRYITEGETPERIREKALSSGGIKTKRKFQI